MAKIDLGFDAGRDRVIVEQTIEVKLSYLSDAKALIIETLSHLAQGSALWTKTIVELIEVCIVRAIGQSEFSWRK
jgi:hypothetical protein